VSYVPPQGDEVALDFNAGSYTPPNGSMVALEFAPGGGPPVGTDQYSFPPGFDAASIGATSIRLASLFVDLPGRGIAPANGYGRAGIPDFVACVAGTFVAIEAKGKGGKTTALQDRELQRINDAGGIALVVTHEHDVRAVVAATCDLARARRNSGETK